MGDELIKNHKNIWFRSPLVSYQGFPKGLRGRLYAHHFGHATMGTRDANFTMDVTLALPKDDFLDANFSVGHDGAENECLETCGYCDKVD